MKKCTLGTNPHDPKKYPGTIKARNTDGTYFVLFNDGDQDPKCAESSIFEYGTEAERKRIVSSNDLSTRQHPHAHLASNKTAFDLLFNFLGEASAVGRTVWAVLNRLPTNVALKQSISVLVDETKVDWAVHLPSTSLIKLLYILQVVEKNCVTPVEDSNAAPSLVRMSSLEHSHSLQDWGRMFINTGGFLHLLSIFNSVSSESVFASDLSVQCISLILSLVTFFLTGNESSNGVDGKTVLTQLDTPAMMSRLLQLLDLAVGADAEVSGKDAVAKLVTSILSAVHSLLIMSPTAYDSLYGNTHWISILERGLLFCHIAPVRGAIRDALLELCRADGNTRHFFLPRLLGLLLKLDTSADDKYCAELLELLEQLLAFPVRGAALQLDLVALSAQLTDLIENHPSSEPTEATIDTVLLRLLNLTRQLIVQNPSLKNTLGETLLAAVLRCLFDLPNANFSGDHSVVPLPKCKSPSSRKSAFDLVTVLCNANTQNMGLAVKILLPNHLITHSNGKVPTDFAFEVKSLAVDGRQSYTGLVNLGCICYMNAANQQLFMIPKLRQNILAIDQYDEKDLAKSVLYNLQHVFGYLQESTQRAINPKPFCNVWTDEYGELINVAKQEDSHGYVNRLIDRVGEMIKGTRHKNALTDVLGGTFQHQMIGYGECKHFKVRQEQFVNILVEIKQKKNLTESLQAFVQGEMMAGENAYKCDCCAKKVDTLRRTVIDHLPPTLCIALKRFELDFTTFQPLKVNDRCDFPMDLDMKPYTSEFLTSEEQLKCKDETKLILDRLEAEAAVTRAAAAAAKAAGKAPEAKGSAPAAPVEIKAATSDKTKEGDEAPAPEVAVKKVTHPDEYYRYRLKGVVVHTGTAHGGHYYSYIQERLPNNAEGRWFEFNDASVTPFDVNRLGDETFGGNKGSGGYGGVANGYLLFYDRVSPSKVAEAESQDGLSMGGAVQVARFANKMTKIRDTMRTRARLPPMIFHQIWEQNLTYWRDRNVYDDRYFEFLWDLVSSYLSSRVSAAEQLAESLGKLSVADSKGNLCDVNEPADTRDAITRLATRFFFMTLARAKNKSSINQWAGALKKLYDGNVSSCAWFLNRMTRSQWIFEGLFLNPLPLVHRITSQLLQIAFTVISPLEQANYAFPAGEVPPLPTDGSDVRVDARGYAVGMAAKLISMLPMAAQYHKVWDNFFCILAHVAKLGRAEKSFLQAQNIEAKLVDLYLGPLSPHPELNPGTTNAMGTRVAMLEPNLQSLFSLLGSLVEGVSLENMSPLLGEMLTVKAFLQNFIMEATTYRVGLGVVAVLSTLCRDLTIARQIIAIIEAGMLQHPHDSMRPFFRVIQGILAVEGPNQDVLINLFMEMLVRSTMHPDQRHYWKIIDFLADHILRLAKKNGKVADWLHHNTAFVEFVLKWFDANPTPPLTTVDRKALNSATLYAQPLGFIFTQTSQYGPYHISVADKVALFRQIQHDPSALVSAGGSDSDRDVETRQYELKQFIEVLDEQRTWLRCEVIDLDRNLQKIKVHYCGFLEKYDEWIPVTSKRIAPDGAFQHLKPKQPAAPVR